MSEAIAFDTHRYIKRLTESGFSEKQAETLADEQIAVLNSNLATKADIVAIQADIAAMQAAIADAQAAIADAQAAIAAAQVAIADAQVAIAAAHADIAAMQAAIATMQADIEKLNQETKVEIAKIEAGIERVKSELLKWFIGALIAQGSLIVALTAFL